MTPVPFSWHNAVQSGNLLAIEAEDFPLKGDWALIESADASGGAYLQFNGKNHYAAAQDAHAITKQINVPQAGTYVVKWYMRQPSDAEGDKSNDIWIGFPDAIQKGNGQTITGFHKYFGRSKGRFGMNGQIEAHHKHSWLNVEFPKPGTYTMQVSGRSEFLQVDQFLLYRELNADDVLELLEVGR
ncbi:hypothetical protein SAMN06265222_1287 [Neorhodopirellula lusitana]|uniref:Uncharacterized protein n=1 Tax=Neorhodopirellula lusitana TaxID=445327 RepID=A0ABY1QV97_9BACT|nr:hypothetical protein [Neorhodopirellula lusitana]SMP78835.1 hypothetical protein SAMN06265222_1287 [Neorhodopirellula lusitana]